MAIHHPLLLRQLKRLGIDAEKFAISEQQWLLLLESIDRAYMDGEQERHLMARSQSLSSTEMQTLYAQLEEAQRIAKLGNWSFDRRTRTTHWSKECFRIFGLDAEAEIPNFKEISRHVHPDDRIQIKDRAEAALHDGREFELEFRWQLPSNGVSWIRVIGQVSKQDDGKVIRVHGTVMDVTARKLVELRQTMEHTVTRLLADADRPEEVMPEVIQTVCETMNWECGAFWMLDRQDGSLHRTATWAIPRPRIETFFKISQPTIPSTSPMGLLGRAIQKKSPVWNTETYHDPSTTRNYHMDVGLRATFAFPILAAGETLGVMEFYTRQIQEIVPEVVHSAQFIGRHIGQFFQRKQAEDALRESEAHFRSLVEQASDAFFVHDVEGRMIDVNQHGCNSLGYTRQELLNMNIADIDVDMSVSELLYLRDQVVAKAPVALESRHKRKDGSIFPVEIRVGPIDIDGQRHLLSLVRDVTERKELQDHIQHLAYHDALTNLPNRAMFNRHLSHAISQAQRYHKGLAVLFIDLDRFKNVNDTLGHDAGDRLLKEMARRLSACLRGSDVVARLEEPADLVARLGGDEFVVLVEEVTDSTRVSHIARKILASLVKEFPLDGQIIHMTASIGISMFPEDGRNEFSLMKHADIAMYRAKERGKNTFQFYSAQMDLHSAELLALESGLRRALERNEFVLYYQAKVETQTGKISGVEVLVRWQHPELGLVSPVHFIPLAEESGLIVPLSQWVLEQALTQHRQWEEQGLPELRIAVNLSARQFADDNLLNDTIRALKQFGVNPELLELEITESMMMYNTEKSIQILSALRELGIRVAVDDFGIGYSSLSHLKQFPVDIIKIDRSFIKDIPNDKTDAAITEAIIAIGKSLNIQVVAEGVETVEQLEFLRERNCDEIQGYYFSRPLPARDFVKLLASNMIEVEV